MLFPLDISFNARHFLLFSAANQSQFMVATLSAVILDNYEIGEKSSRRLLGQTRPEDEAHDRL